jgi:hypothetical protein
MELHQQMLTSSELIRELVVRFPARTETAKP